MFSGTPDGSSPVATFADARSSWRLRARGDRRRALRPGGAGDTIGSEPAGARHDRRRSSERQHGRQRAPAPRSGRPAGPSPVVLNAYFETGFDIPFKLSEEFTKQFPNVTWKISQDQFANLMTSTPRLLAGDNPPDLIRLPTMVSLVKDGLLKNLDGYVDGLRLGQVAGRRSSPRTASGRTAPAAPARSTRPV